MRAEISSELLLRLMNATPEQYAAVERILGVNAECGVRSAEFSTPYPTRSLIEAERVTATAPRNLFRLAGSHWMVVFDGREVFHLEDTLGARYLDYLLHHPGDVISAFDLEVAILPEKAQARARDSIQTQLDPETARSYLRELSRLRTERDAAAERGDMARTDQHDEEIEALEEALQANGRETGDAGERARNNVSKAFAVVRRRLAKGNPAEKEFGHYLEQFVSVGYECSYRMPRGKIWEA